MNAHEYLMAAVKELNVDKTQTAGKTKAYAHIAEALLSLDQHSTEAALAIQYADRQAQTKKEMQDRLAKKAAEIKASRSDITPQTKDSTVRNATGQVTIQ